MRVECPYCHNDAELVHSSVIYGYKDKNYGMFWLCVPCDAYVGTHKNSSFHAPLGRLANKELRRWKQNAHAVFDPIWKDHRRPDCVSRKAAYAIMAKLLGLPKDKAHIGKLDIEQCKKLVELLRPKITD
jgi:hypothetical protein